MHVFSVNLRKKSLQIYLKKRKMISFSVLLLLSPIYSTQTDDKKTQ